MFYQKSFHSFRLYVLDVFAFSTRFAIFSSSFVRYQIIWQSSAYIQWDWNGTKANVQRSLRNLCRGRIRRFGEQDKRHGKTEIENKKEREKEESESRERKRKSNEKIRMLKQKDILNNVMRKKMRQTHKKGVVKSCVCVWKCFEIRSRHIPWGWFLQLRRLTLNILQLLQTFSLNKSSNKNLLSILCDPNIRQDPFQKGIM